MTRMFKIFEIKRDSFYAWKRRGISKRELFDNEIASEIDSIWNRSRKKCYGTPRLLGELKDMGYSLGHNKVARIMKVRNMKATRRRKHKYFLPKNKGALAMPNVVDRKFNPGIANNIWVTDITYIQLTTGWAYLCVFIDLFSRIVVGWKVSSSPNTELVLSALKIALGKRKTTEGLIIHSDQGCQYTSENYKNKLKDHGFIQSMSRRGNCWDNACVESFFGTLKQEELFGEIFKTKEEVEMRVFEYIESFYNNERRHSSCGNLSPAKFEKENIA